MKKLKLLTLMIVMTIFLVSCSSTAENNSEVEQQTSEQTILSNLNEEVQDEAVNEAEIEEEEMQIQEEVEQEMEEGKVEVKSQAPKIKSTEVLTPKTVELTPTLTETKATKPTTKSPKTISKPIVETTKQKTTKKPITQVVSKPKASGKPSHSAFNSLLNKYVTPLGSVNYAGFKSQKTALDEYLNDLAENPVQSSWSKNEKMAYWINLYNAGTIMLILDNYPTSSIQNINDGKPWDKRWIKSGTKTYTLNEIENTILRPQFKDARIHFAVNCAATSCPRLMNQAFTESNLNSLLDENARWFINNSTFNNISAKKVEISKVFDWYAADFGNIIEYLNKYSTTEIKSGAKVSYKEYNWKLNGK